MEKTNIVLLIAFLPLVLVLLLANLADKKREEPRKLFAILTYFALGLFWSILAVGGLLILLGGLFPDGMGGSPPGAEPLQPGQQVQFGLAFLIPAFVGVILLLPPVRRFIARFLNIDPSHTVHAVALSYTMLIVAIQWEVSAFGLDYMARDLAASPEITTSQMIGEKWIQNTMLLLMAFIGIGWLVRRDWRHSLSRLGLVLPTWRQVLGSVALAGIFIIALILLDWFLQFFGLGFDEDVQRVTEQLVGPLMQTIPGILTFGLAAALGEELVFRGALQPRFGLLLTAILFALFHFQYGITLSTAVVLILGLVLGWQRIRYNTSSAMITHATYNITLGLMAFLNLWPEW